MLNWKIEISYLFVLVYGLCVCAGALGSNGFGGDHILSVGGGELGGDSTLYVLEVDSTVGGMVVYPETYEGVYREGCIIPIEVEMIDPNLFVFKGWSGSAVNAGFVVDPHALTTTVLMRDNCNLMAIFESRHQRLYVDDSRVNDPLENGTQEHPFNRIQEALEVAPADAQVVVSSGTYYEHLKFGDRSITLLGYDPNDFNVPVTYPLLDVNRTECNQVSPLITLMDPSLDVNIVISGFMFSGGGSVLSCNGQDVTLSNCLFVGNRIIDANIGMIDCNDSNTVMVHCTVSDNLGIAISLKKSTLSLYNSILWGVDEESVFLDESSALFLDHVACSYAWEGEKVCYSDPLFVSNGIWEELVEEQWSWSSGDYHLQSEFGRWSDESGQWEYDSNTSLYLGVGDPDIWQDLDLSYSGEYAMDFGAYGGTPMALAAAQCPVAFWDENLKAAVEEALWLDDPTPPDMLELRSLHISSERIEDLTGLEFATQMTNVLLVKNHLAEIEPLSGLQNLRYVHINNNLVSDVSPLAGLTGLLHLNIHENMIQDVSGLGALVNLTLLDIHDNQITDISALLGMTQLEKLVIQQNDIDHISALAQMTQLETLSFSFNEVSDVSPLAGLTALKDLDLGYNPIADISILSHLENLQDVKFESCNVVDISSLCALLQLETVRMRRNPLNGQAYSECLHTIAENNPGVLLYYDPNPTPPENLTDCTTDPAVGISLCWDPVANGPNYTSYYRVYRSVGDSVTQTPVSDWQIETQYVDTDTQLGQRYSYWVQCAVTVEGDDAGQMSEQLSVQTSSQSRLVISSGLGGEVIEPGDLYLDHSATSFAWEGPGVFHLDPLFASAGFWIEQGDEAMVWVPGHYHLRSKYGRWNPESAQWETDTQTSPCIGAGGISIWEKEGWIPRVDVLNCGAYGGTLAGSWLEND